jgi:hypothetical protein
MSAGTSSIDSVSRGESHQLLCLADTHRFQMIRLKKILLVQLPPKGGSGVSGGL